VDFFTHQDRARRKTGQLVGLFVLAVILILLAVNAAVGGAWLLFGAKATTQGLAESGARGIDPALVGIVTLATLAVIGLGTLYRMLQLSRGGRAVAELVGARPLDPSTGEPAERRLLNVVEEMSIASGVPVPAVYVMDDEQGINAFAAGFSPTEAVIAVTRGTLDSLNRDELQGVIAHEFSHIFNGDMRINIRLLGVLNGILIIGAIGLHVLRGLGRGGVRVRSSGRGGGGAGVALVALVAVALAVIGYIGLFFGRLIKAAVSRQREFLADASAVQFTRNPSGIAGALNKIRLHTGGALVADRHAEELSHMFFGQAMRLRLFSHLLATHPPLEERIRRIDPSFDMKSTEPAEPRPAAAVEAVPEASSGLSAGGGASAPSEAVDSVGNPDVRHATYAAALHALIPDEVLDRVRREDGARAAVCALLLSSEAKIRNAQLEILRHRETGGFADQAEAVAGALEPIGPRVRLPLLDLATPALRRLAAHRRSSLLETVNTLIAADGKVSLGEYLLQLLLALRLDESAERAEPVRFKILDPVLPDCALLLSLLAQVGNRNDSDAESAFARGTQMLGINGATPPQRGFHRIGDLNRALRRLRGLSFALRKRVVAACSETVLADGRATDAETEFLRAACEFIDCPMPPLLPADPIAH